MGRHDGCHKVTCIHWKHGGRALCEAIPANSGSALVCTIVGRLDVVLLQGLSMSRGSPLKATMLHYGLFNQRKKTTPTMSMSLNNFNLTLAARRCASDGSRAVMTRKRSHGPAGRNSQCSNHWCLVTLALLLSLWRRYLVCVPLVSRSTMLSTHPQSYSHASTPRVNRITGVK